MCETVTARDNAWLILMQFAIRISYKILHAHHEFIKYRQYSSIHFNKSIQKIYEIPEFRLQKFLYLLYFFPVGIYTSVDSFYFVTGHNQLTTCIER
jgi:hypothetical protein